MEMTKELLEKAKNAKTAEELLALVHENGLPDFTAADAEALFEKLGKSCELADEELDHVAGGKGHSTEKTESVPDSVAAGSFPGYETEDRYCQYCKCIRPVIHMNFGSMTLYSCTVCDQFTELLG